MKLAQPHHKELFDRLIQVFADKENGLMPDQSAPCYAGLSRCWGWHGPSNSTGYSIIPIHRWQYAGHRASYFVHHGEIPEGMVIRHRCDNKICTNPEHLEIGTHADNMKDVADRRDYMTTVESNLKSKGSLRRVQNKVQEMLNFFFLNEVVFCGRHKDDSTERMMEDWLRMGVRLRSFGMEIAAEANPKFQYYLVDENEPFRIIDCTKPHEEQPYETRMKKYIREYMRKYRREKKMKNLNQLASTQNPA